MADAIGRRPDGAWHVVSEDGPHTAYAVTDADGRVWVHVDGQVVVVEANERVTTRRGTRSGGELEAPMPSQVTAVLVTAGDSVTQGTPLLVLEAMKMELPLRAPHDGRVVAVHCTVGDRVGPGRALVDLSAPEGPA